MIILMIIVEEKDRYAFVMESFLTIRHNRKVQLQELSSELISVDDKHPKSKLQNEVHPHRVALTTFHFPLYCIYIF